MASPNIPSYAKPYSTQVFAVKANLEYMIFCKFLWEVLKKDVGQLPCVGWNISPTYGLMYLFQERHDSKKSKIYDNDGHHFVTAQGKTVAYTAMLEMAEGLPGSRGRRWRDIALRLGAGLEARGFRLCLWSLPLVLEVEGGGHPLSASSGS